MSQKSNAFSKKEKELIHEAFNSLTRAPKNLHIHGLDNPNALDNANQHAHKGTVEDPENDGRLSENREKKDKEEDEARRKEKEQEEIEEKEQERRHIQKNLNQVKNRHESFIGTASLSSKVSNEESILRNHFTYGAAINQILGTKADFNSLKKVRESLIKQEASTKSITDNNEIHQLLSYVASLMIKSNSLKNK